MPKDCRLKKNDLFTVVEIEITGLLLKELIDDTINLFWDRGPRSFFV
jgi:hypothetical protein